MLVRAQLVERDEVSVRDFMLLIWRSRMIALYIIIGCTLVGTGVALIMPKEYRATVVLAPVSNSGAGRLTSQVSSLSNLTALIGIPVGGDSERYEAIAVLQSRALTEEYIREQGLLSTLIPMHSRTPFGRWWRQLVARRPPTLLAGAERFAKIREVSEDRRTGLYTMAVTWTDPAMAAKWANDLVGLANNYLRQRAITVSEKHISYLSQEVSRTDAAEVRNAIYAVMESEIKNVMLAKGPGEYALRVLDPALPPENSDSPKVGLWVLGGFAAGILVSLVSLFMQAAWHAGDTAGGQA